MSTRALLSYARGVPARPPTHSEGEEARPRSLGRRRFLAGVGAVSVASAFGPSVRSVLADLVRAERGGDAFGSLLGPDELGVRLPVGFTATLVGRTGDPTGASGYHWHALPDGGACFSVPGSNDVVYVSNSEVPVGGGGVGAARVDPDGVVVDAWPILSGTSMNCAGGATPWGTWLSCEEVHPDGQVWECDPFGGPAAVRPALGAFRHEAVAVDAARQRLYLTEDLQAGRLYRFTPDRWPDLAAGALAAAVVDGEAVAWVDADPGGPDRSASTAAFDGGEGIIVDGDSLFFTTKGDRRVWELDLVHERLTVLHDCVQRPDTPLTHVDNITVHPTTRELFVAEDGGNMELCALIREPGGLRVVTVLRFEGHDGSEVAGPAFSPDGKHLFVSSQRGTDGRGVTVRVSGPFEGLVRSIGGPATVTRQAERIGPTDP